MDGARFVGLDHFAARSRALALLAVVMLAPASALTATPLSLGLHLTSCTQGHSKVSASCGTFGVFENRAAHAGRVISLSVVLLKARRPTHNAIAMIAGGPGQSAVFFAPLIADGVYVKALSTLRDRYNILLVDNRGMGDSHPFGCDFAPVRDPQAYFRQLFPDKIVAACRAESAANRNVNSYNTNNAVDDLDDIRARLGFPRLVLNGGSYGTYFSLIYIRRHPTHVASAILDGVAAPHFVPLPGSPDGAQTALDDLIVKCRHDRVCNAHFPEFGKHFKALMVRFDRGPISVPLKNAATGRFEPLMLSKEAFVDRFRQTLYDPQTAASIPYVVDQAFYGHYVPLGELVNGMAVALGHALDWGAFLSYTCAEEIPFVSNAEIKRAAEGSFAGDVRVRAQRHACAIWNVRRMPAEFNDPVRSGLPILMLTGSDDPTTPPRYAAEALPYLRNARQVIVRGAGHTTETPCTDGLIVQFVRAGSAKGLDLSACSAAFKVPPFATSDQ